MRQETLDRSSTAQAAGMRSAEFPTGAEHSGNGPAHLGKSIKVKGEIRGTEDLFIDGEVEGTIELLGNKVTVGPDGRVQADVSAKNLSVVGRLAGKARVAEKTEIRATGTVEGDVSTARISIDYGAVLHATVEVVRPEQDFKGSSSKSAAKGKPAAPSTDAEASDREAAAELQLTAS